MAYMLLSSFASVTKQVMVEKNGSGKVSAVWYFTPRANVTSVIIPTPNIRAYDRDEIPIKEEGLEEEDQEWREAHPRSRSATMESLFSFALGGAAGKDPMEKSQNLSEERLSVWTQSGKLLSQESISRKVDWIRKDRLEVQKEEEKKMRKEGKSMEREQRTTKKATQGGELRKMHSVTTSEKATPVPDATGSVQRSRKSETYQYCDTTHREPEKKRRRSKKPKAERKESESALAKAMFDPDEQPSTSTWQPPALGSFPSGTQIYPFPDVHISEEEAELIARLFEQDDEEKLEKEE